MSGPWPRRPGCSRSRRSGWPRRRRTRRRRFPDERLELIFTCCHPALATEAQVALTLRTLGGLTTAGDRPRLPRRRARRWRSGWCAPSARSRRPGFPSGCRRITCCPTGSTAVLAVVYLIFNEGYGGRGELAAEAIRLGRALAELMPDEPEVQALLALMLLHDARREARFDGGGAGPARRPGPRALGRGADRRRSGRARAGAGAARARALRDPGGDRLPSRRRAPRLAPDRRPLRRAGAADRVAGGRAQPRRRRGRGRGPRGGRWHSSSASSSTSTGTCTRPAASCCAAWGGRTRPVPPTPGRSSSSTTTPSGACSSGGCGRSASGRALRRGVRTFRSCRAPCRSRASRRVPRSGGRPRR